MLRLLFLTLVLPGFVASQGLVENRIDESAKRMIRNSAWEPFTRSRGLTSFVQVSQLDSIRFINLKLSDIGKTSIRETDELEFTMENDSIVRLYPMTSETSCRACGSINLAGQEFLGINVKYIVKQHFDLLSNRRIKKIRIRTSRGYLESDVIARFSSTLMNQLRLLL